MPRFGPISRDDLVRGLRQAGFTGPEAGGRHPAMRRGSFTVHVPNVHRGEVGRDLLSRVLRRAGISRDEWEKL